MQKPKKGSVIKIFKDKLKQNFNQIIVLISNYHLKKCCKNLKEKRKK